MSKNKLRKFAEMSQFPNVYQNFNFQEPQLIGAKGKEVKLKGAWKEKHFKNQNPITLELACGRGEYTVALATKYPERNFIGIDIKGARMYKGAKKALNDDLANAAFLRIRIEQLEAFFADNEIAEIWITFPDPFPKRSDENKRLTAPIFLNKYKRILKPGGLVHLKTDAASLYDYSLEIARQFNGLRVREQEDQIYSGRMVHNDLEIKTNYEIMHLAKGKQIKYLQMRVTEE